jgi:hypothetical protein
VCIFLKHQDAATTVFEGIGIMQIFIAAVAADSQTEIDSFMR